MSQSLYTSMGGIAAATTELSVVSNNVANINTTAYKGSSVQFSDVYYSTLSYGSVATSQSGGTNPVQVGVGTKVSSVSTDFSTGSWVATGSDTDLMINGAGFFTVQAADGSTFYTRSGDFSIDSNGNLVTSAGYKVLGTKSILSSTSSGVTVQVPVSIVADVTGNTNLGTTDMNNLNNITSNVTSGYFTVTDTTAVPSTTYHVTLDNADVTDTVNTMVTKMNTELSAQSGGDVTATVGVDGTIKFTSAAGDTLSFASPSGPYVSGGVTYMPSNFLTQTEVASTATAGLYSTKVLDYIVSISDVTAAAVATSSNSTTINTDGSLEVTYKDGSTLSVQLGPDNATYEFVYTTPKAVAITGNKCTVAANIAQPANFVIQMATVTNTEGLLQVGNNLFSAGPNTGDIVYTAAGKMGSGEIESGGLEASNVDLSKELSNMILAQRAVQANSRVFTTTSQIMDVINQMGR